MALRFIEKIKEEENLRNGGISEEHFGIAGVTLKNSDGANRQDILKKIYNDIPPFEDPGVEFERYVSGGTDAVRILVNGVQIGNIKKENVNHFISVAPYITGIAINVDTIDADIGNPVFYAMITVECNAERRRREAAGNRAAAPADNETINKIKKNQKTIISAGILFTIIFIVCCLFSLMILACISVMAAIVCLALILISAVALKDTKM